jgi:EAL domain-containing protein (putative c-di-GMP-specific phosphodiesterase class I)
MLEQPQNEKIVRSLIDLAHNLELKVVAEGVESHEILTALDQLGCDHAQGWDVGKPMTAADLTARLRSLKS